MTQPPQKFEATCPLMWCEALAQQSAPCKCLKSSIDEAQCARVIHKDTNQMFGSVIYIIRPNCLAKLVLC